MEASEAHPCHINHNTNKNYCTQETCRKYDKKRNDGNDRKLVKFHGADKIYHAIHQFINKIYSQFLMTTME